MPNADINGTTIHYEVTGDRNDKPFLLISGVGTQLTRYSEAFSKQLADQGFYVIRMDNRDIGLSGGFDNLGVPNLRDMVRELASGKLPTSPYSLDDMADDCAALLDHLECAPAHVAGSSMGGMIAQLLAIRHPGHVTTMTSIMSTTGHASVPRATPEAMAVLTGKRSDPAEDRETYIDESIASSKTIGSPGYPEGDSVIRARALADLDRAFRPAGFVRQYAAILAAPHRRDMLADLKMPCLVIHGTDDPLVRVEGGRDTANSIPGSELLEIEGMGHDIPSGLYDQIVSALCGVAARAS